MDDPLRPAQTPPDGAPSGTARTLLNVAAAIVFVEAVGFLVLAVLGLVDRSAGTVGTAAGIALLLGAYGIGLLVAAAHVRRGRAWGRAPIVVSQIIQLLVAWSARDDGAWVLPVLGAGALVVLGCLLAPPVTRALSANRSV